METEKRTEDSIYSDEKAVYRQLESVEEQLVSLARYEEALLSDYGASLSYVKHLLTISSTSSLFNFYEDLVGRMERTHYQLEDGLGEQRDSLKKEQASLEEQLDSLRQEIINLLVKEEIAQEKEKRYG